MQCKWAKLSLKNLIKIGILSSLALSPLASATITVSVGNGGSVSAATTGGGTIYYFVKYNGSPTAPSGNAFALFTPLDVYYTIVSDPSLTNMFRIKLVSDKKPTLTGSQAVVFAIYPATAAGAGTIAAPIAAVSGVACNNGSYGGNNCIAQGQYGYLPVGGNASFYAVKYPTYNTQMEVGFYPQDWCASAAVSSSTPTGCTAGALNQPQAVGTGTPTTMSFTVSSYIVNDTLPATVPSGTPFDQTTGVVNLSFQVDSPTHRCATQPEINASYVPGDGTIFINTAYFGATLAQSSNAPVSSLYVLANENATPVVSSLFNSANSVSQQIGVGGDAVAITGFRNSDGTTENDHPYQMTVIAQTADGVYVTPNGGVSNCLISPVRTADVQAFLKRSKCFIATATFRSEDAVPVMLLRQLRDEVLLRTSLGKSFVQAYYKWSPPAAEWLVENPLFRLPFLIWLFPLQILAWVMLHPGIVFISLGLFSLLGPIAFRRSE